MSDGRKIGRDIENPIDNIVIDLAWAASGPLRAVGIVPNQVTTLALMFGLIAAWFVYRGRFWEGAGFFAFSYLMDCMDGNMARRYGMVTAFGDWYDHISDIVKTVALYWAVVVCSSLRVGQRMAFVGVTGLLMALMLVHLGCQEKSYPKTGTDSMSALEMLCPGPYAIFWTRYVGMGTWVMAVCILLVLFSAQ